MKSIRWKSVLVTGLVVLILAACSSTASARRYRRYGWRSPYAYGYGYSPYSYGYGYGYSPYSYYGYGPYNNGMGAYGWNGYPFYGGYYSGPNIYYRHYRPYVGRRGFYYGWY